MANTGKTPKKGCERYQNLLEEEKQKLPEHIKKIN